MEKYLEELRKKPIHTRRTILAVSTFSITILIFFVWLYFWLPVFNSPDSVRADISSNTAPYSLIKDNWKNLSETLKNGVSEMRNQLRF